MEKKDLKDLSNFVITKSFKYGESKIVFIGNFNGEIGDAIIILEPEKLVPENIEPGFGTLPLRFDFVNNQYSQFFSNMSSPLVVHVVHPATEKDLKKYSIRESIMVEETGYVYQNVTKKYIEDLEPVGKKWIFDILDGVAEQERTLFKDDHPENGFILSSSWGSGSTLKDIHLLAMVNRRDLFSIRDLNRSHLPLLRNLKTQMEAYVMKTFGCGLDKFILFFHYPPTYYHLHVHGCHLDTFERGMEMHKGRLLDEVIGNIELLDNYYQHCTLTYMSSLESPLYLLIKEYKAITQDIAQVI